MALAVIAFAAGWLLVAKANARPAAEEAADNMERIQYAHRGEHLINTGPAFRDRDHASRAQQLGESMVTQGFPQEGEFLHAAAAYPGAEDIPMTTLGPFTGYLPRDAALRMRLENDLRASRIYWRKVPDTDRHVDQQLYGPNFHLQRADDSALLTF